MLELRKEFKRFGFGMIDYKFGKKKADFFFPLGT